MKSTINICTNYNIFSKVSSVLSSCFLVSGSLDWTKGKSLLSWSSFETIGDDWRFSYKNVSRTKSKCTVHYIVVHKSYENPSGHNSESVKYG